MDKVHFVDLDAEALSSEQKQKLASIVKHADGLVGLNCYGNLDTRHCEDDMPEGISLYFDPNAVVDPTLISDRMFEVLAVSQVLAGPWGQELNDEHFKGLLDVIGQAVPQHATNPAPLRGATAAPWQAELGGVDSFVGAYSELQANHRDKNYYIAARGTAPMMVQELKDIIAQERPTYRDLCYGSSAITRQVKQAKSIAADNVRRAIMQVAEACRVDIRREQSLGAKVLDAAHEAQPEQAAPTWSQQTHSIQSCMYGGKPVIALYYGVVPKETCQQYIASSGSPFFVVASPFDGLRGFRLTKPVETSALICAAPRTPTKAKELKNGELARRTNTITWEGKTAQHADIHPEAFKNVSRKAIPGADHSVRMLIPLAVKIYDASSKRK